jgi:hypothetical protein
MLVIGWSVALDTMDRFAFHFSSVVSGSETFLLFVRTVFAVVT